MADIAFDTTSSGTNTGTTLTFSHTCTGDDRVLLVWAFNENASDLITGVTYNGVAMTLIDRAQRQGAQYPSSGWLLIAPATGANDIVVTASSSTPVRAAGISYTGCNQSSQPDTFSSGSPAASSSTTMTMTTVVNNCWGVVLTTPETRTATASTNVTQRFESLLGASYHIFIGDSNANITPAGIFAQTITHANAQVGYVQVSLAPLSDTQNALAMSNF